MNYPQSDSSQLPLKTELKGLVKSTQATLYENRSPHIRKGKYHKATIFIARSVNRAGNLLYRLTMKFQTKAVHVTECTLLSLQSSAVTESADTM